MKIGLYGGTFDPIHNGHLKVAESAKDALGLEQVIFIPAGEPPHKTEKQITEKEHRLAMTELAIAGKDGFFLSDWELLQDKKSYSVDMVKHFLNEFPEDEIYFIIGADSFHDLPLWWHYEELMSLCSFVVISRPDTKKEELLSLFTGNETPPRVFFLDGIFVDISSTELREASFGGKDISHFVPPEVFVYIQKHNLYR